MAHLNGNETFLAASVKLAAEELSYRYFNTRDNHDR